MDILFDQLISALCPHFVSEYTLNFHKTLFGQQRTLILWNVTLQLFTIAWCMLLLGI